MTATKENKGHNNKVAFQSKNERDICFRKHFSIIVYFLMRTKFQKKFIKYLKQFKIAILSICIQ